MQDETNQTREVNVTHPMAKRTAKKQHKHHTNIIAFSIAQQIIVIGILFG